MLCVNNFFYFLLKIVFVNLCLAKIKGKRNVFNYFKIEILIVT